MFTGIVAALGHVRRRQAGRLWLSLPRGFPLRPGDSVAVNGVCLTAVEVGSEAFCADLSPETLRRTALGELRAGEPVNLERPLAAGAPLGGHLVQGHVDAVGRVVRLAPEGEGHLLVVAVEPAWDRYLVEKGSVAVDGISLTAFDVGGGRFSAAVVPYTWRHTNLHAKRAGDPVNVEFDVLGKYVEKLLAPYRDRLAQAGAARMTQAGGGT